MAWPCVVKHCITKHSNAKQGIAKRRRAQHRTACHGMAPGFCWRVNGSSSRELGRSGVAAPWSAPWAPRKAPHKAALLATSPSQSRLGKIATTTTTTTTTGARRTEGLVVAGLPAPGGGRGHLPGRLRGAGASHLPHRLRGERRVVFRGRPLGTAEKIRIVKNTYENQTRRNPVCKKKQYAEGGRTLSGQTQGREESSIHIE